MKWSRTHHRVHTRSRHSSTTKWNSTYYNYYYCCCWYLLFQSRTLPSTLLFRFVCFYIDLYHLSREHMYMCMSVCVWVWFIWIFNIWKTSNRRCIFALLESPKSHDIWVCCHDCFIFVFLCLTLSLFRFVSSHRRDQTLCFHRHFECHFINDSIFFHWKVNKKLKSLQFNHRLESIYSVIAMRTRVESHVCVLLYSSRIHEMRAHIFWMHSN